MKKEQVILVDRDDLPLGLTEKMKAHREGILHRAFSIFIFNEKNDLLLQKRAAHKYHSPSLWTNTCCSHQRKGESNLQAANRRLQEEMGIQTPLKELFSFIYKATLKNGLIEHEYDHIIIGKFEGKFVINPEEVADFKWMPLDKIKTSIQEKPEIYTEWFKIILEKFYFRFKNKK